VTFFFDRHIAWEIVVVLRQENGVNAVERSKGIGPKDEQWLPRAGQNEWIVITLDHQILSRKLQKKALRDHQVTAFFCARELNSKLAHTRLEWFQQHWKAIEQKAAKARPGDVFLVLQRRERKRHGLAL
jgi:uncharacterized protein YfaT (DUF1175 family)